ncbi:MAG TPA: class I SAM-dependent methyltransferase [Candidatus Limnocylindria bacterium]|nr:class I SAM-dependent methyltransferase [Candidatus Limnocylindria bacterium]
MKLTPHARRNRAFWNELADSYQADHGPHLDVHGAAWGVWQIPEDELRVLGDVAGRDLLELGCGAAQWSIALARRGARPVGLDLSERQLGHARMRMAEAGLSFPLVHASAEDVPLPDASFDVIFCDHGAMVFGDPARTVPEASRLLRDGGILAFSMHTPFADVAWPPDEDEPTERLANDYFGMRVVDVGASEHVEFQLTYGDWIRLFVAHDLEVVDLVELRPAADAVSSYRSAAARDWARRWPLEHIWKVRRRPRAG